MTINSDYESGHKIGEFLIERAQVIPVYTYDLGAIESLAMVENMLFLGSREKISGCSKTIFEVKILA